MRAIRGVDVGQIFEVRLLHLIREGMRLNWRMENVSDVRKQVIYRRIVSMTPLSSNVRDQGIWQLIVR